MSERRIVWRNIFYLIPVPVLYVSWLVRSGMAGRSYGVFIAIRSDYRRDAGLLAHELQHCRQFYRSAGLSALLYAISRKHRYRQELECYAVQLAHAQPKELLHLVGLFASFIATKYGLRVTREQVRDDLLDRYFKDKAR